MIKTLSLIVCITMLGIDYQLLAQTDSLQIAVVDESVSFSNYGFKIDKLEADSISSTSSLLYMFLPMTDNFSPNVNVMTQEYEGDLAAFKELSDGQFEAMNLEVISSTIEKDIYIVEYKGKMQSMELHFYAKAFQHNGLFYLATATCTPKQWEENAERLKSVVNSFEPQ